MRCGGQGRRGWPCADEGRGEVGIAEKGFEEEMLGAEALNPGKGVGAKVRVLF